MEYNICKNRRNYGGSPAYLNPLGFLAGNLATLVVGGSGIFAGDMMTVQELRKILSKHHVDTSFYSLMEHRPMVGEENTALDKADGGSRVRTIERMQTIEEKHFEDEAAACRYVLKELAYDYPELKAYLN